jgi:hypothetical protein
MQGRGGLETAAAMEVDEARHREDYDEVEVGAASGSSSNAGSPPAEHDGHGTIHRFRCPFCPQSYTRSHNLKSHLLTHSQERPYTCPTCSSKFRRLHDLKRHLKLHTGEKPHVCEKCGRRFARGDALVRHLKTSGPCTDKQDITDAPETNLEAAESTLGQPLVDATAVNGDRLPLALRGINDMSRIRPTLIGPAYANEFHPRHVPTGPTPAPPPASAGSVDHRLGKVVSPSTGRTTLPSSTSLVESLNLPPPIGLRLPAPFSRTPPNAAQSNSADVGSNGPSTNTEDPWSAVRLLEARIRVLEDRLYVAENRIAVLEGRL